MSSIDPARLFVQELTDPPLPNEPQQKYDIFRLTPTGPQQVNLCGFNFFAEIVGVPGNVTEGFELWNNAEGSSTPDLTGPKYGMKFNQYLDKLKGAGINYLRLFIFNPQRVRHYPFLVETINHVSKFSLDKVSPAFLQRLTEFVGKARAHGIVVCISLSSIQAIADSEAWKDNPFNAANNHNKLIENVADARSTYCVIRKPPDGPYDPKWNAQQRLYWIQRNLFTEIVTATKPFWNVTYELFNEPNPNIAEVIPWHVEAATWLNGLLFDPARAARARLVSATADDRLLDATNFLDQLLPATGARLIDVFSFHGGGGDLPSQWGGPHGRGRANVCRQSVAPTRPQIVNGMDETVTNGKIVHHKGILDAFRRFQSRPVALIFDGDAHYWAQKAPKLYVEELLRRNASFAYRWGGEFINEVNEQCQLTANPPRLGLDQQLGKITAAQFRDRITVF
jgi:hypothetical protein